MPRISMLLVCCLAELACLTAQVPLYPIRQHNKLGYVTIWGWKPEIAIAPKYDGFSDTLFWQTGSPSPFRLFEQNEKTGLIDDSLKEVLPPLFQYISPLTRNYFAVRSDSLLSLVKRGGALVLQDKFDDVFALSKDSTTAIQYIVIKKQDRLGVFSVDSGLLFEPRFGRLELALDRGFFKVKAAGSDKTGWGIADRHGKIILPFAYNDVKAFHPRLFAVKISVATEDETTHEVRMVDKWKIVLDSIEQKDVFERIEALNANWVLCSNTASEPTQLWNLDSVEIAVCKYKVLSALDKERLLCADESGRRGILDNQLNILVPPGFSKIEYAGFPGLFRAKGKTGWGMLAPARSDTTVLPLVFDEIRDFEDSIAFVLKKDKWGAINFIPDTIVPCLFSKLERTSARVLSGTIRDSNEIRVIALDQYFAFQGTTTAGRSIQSVAVFDENIWHEALPSDLAPLPEDKPFDSLTWPKWSDYKSPSFDFTGKMSKTYAFPMIADSLFGLGSENQPLNISYASDLRKSQVYAIKIYGSKRKRIPGSPLMAGCMPFKKGVPYTVFIDSTGLMGLLDRSGHEKYDSSGKALRFTYIGPFNYGLANVCVGGRLVLKEIKDQKIFSLGPYGTMRQLFGWYGEVSAAFLNNNYQYYVEPYQHSQPRWGIIDTLGRFVVEPTLDFISHYYRADSLAKFGRYGGSEKADPVYGIRDKEGRVVFEPKYQRIYRYKDFFIVENRAKPKYIYDVEGRFVRKLDALPQGYLKGFSEGLSPEKDTNGLYGYIDTLGRFVLPARYAAARNFSEGLAAVCLDSAQVWSFIDKSGTVIFTTRIPKKAGPKLGDFKENRCSFPEGFKYGYMNRAGEIVIKPNYRTVTPFSNGVAAITTVDKLAKVEIPGVIDSSGKALYKPNMLFKTIGPFNSAGTAVAQYRNSQKYVLLTSVGEPATEPCDSIVPQSEGFAAFLSDSLWGLYDARGKVILEPRFVEIGPISEGIIGARTEPEGFWNWFDSTGQRLPVEGLVEIRPFNGGYAQAVVRNEEHQKNYPALFDRLGHRLEVPGGIPLYYNDGVFIRRNDSGTELVDKFGNKLLHNGYGELSPAGRKLFITGNARNEWGAINRRGINFISPRYNRILQNGWYLQGVNTRLYGLISRDGRELLSPDYEKIEPMEGGIFRVIRGNEIGYFDLSRGWIWPLQQ